MSVRARKPCSYPCCPELVNAGTRFCVRHQIVSDKARHKQYDKEDRPSYHEWYNSTRWREARLRFLRQNPLCECVDCKRLNRLLPATVVDHKIPHKGNINLFWDMSNWQPMAKRCHDRKSAKEDGGFGRKAIDRG